MDYDTVAHEYDRRYDLNRYPGVRSALRALGGTATRALELGCGSGEWLLELESVGCSVAGIDPSAAMLSRASSRVRGDLRHGFAEDLPWPECSFDAVVAVNALHHFSAPSAAIREALRVLRPGGTFLSIGLDPHDRVPNWYVYDFFPETLARDVERFPSASQRTAWLVAAGFTRIEVKLVERIRSTHTLEEARESGILSASFTSQLTELSENQYSDGIQRIEAAAASTGESFRLRVDLVLYATEARRPGGKL
jgi:ubiquinone/menaquinone biosynthesis C-methylase UbiE